MSTIMATIALPTSFMSEFFEPQTPLFTQQYQILDADSATHFVHYTIFDESCVVKPPDIMILGDLGYLGTDFEIPIKKSKKKKLSKEEKVYNRWHSGLRVGVEHAIR